jgi:hypothetical protein
MTVGGKDERDHATDNQGGEGTEAENEEREENMAT